MTSSGTYNYSISNGEAVLAAFDRVELRPPAILQHHMLSARRELNDLFVELSNRQVNLWKVELDSIALTQGVGTYSIPAKVIMILDAYRSLNQGTQQQTDIYISPISRTIYASQANKQTQGPPIQYWFDRTMSPTVTFWPVPDGGGPYTFNYYNCVQVQDGNLPGGETPDMPYRWLGVLVAGLALRLARIYPPAGVDRLMFKKDRQDDYDRAWDIAAKQDTENVPFTISLGLGSYYRR